MAVDVTVDQRSTPGYAPPDPNVKLPPSVLRATELANATHAQIYGGEPPKPSAPPAPPEPAPAPPETPPPAPPAPPETPPAPPPQSPPAPPQAAPAEPPAPVVTDWEHRYHSMKGRYDQSQATIGGLQEQLQEVGNELLRTQALLRDHRMPQPEPPAPPPPLVTEQEVKTYGPELIDVIHRAAKEAVQPQLNKLDAQNRQTSQRVAAVAQQDVYADLQAQLPNWRDINNNPRFLQWLRLRDVYSGAVRQTMLNAAMKAADAPRVIAFFKGFLAEEQATGHAPNPQPPTQQPPVAPAQPAVPLSSLAAPGRARPAGSEQPVDKPIYTRAQIAKFYDNVRKKVYDGREAEKASEEAAIFAAQREGRVR